MKRLLIPLQRRLKLMITRGVVHLVDANKLLQTLQVNVLGQELLDNVEHWEPYGYTSNPLPGAEALLASLFGKRAHTIAVNVADRRFRLKGLNSGEVAIYTDEGDVVHFQRGNKILIDSANEITINASNKLTANTAVAAVNASTSATVTSPLVNVVASTKCTIDSPATEITGNLQVGGTALVSGALSSATSVADPTGTMQSMRTTYNSHTHKENDNAGQTDATGQTM